MEPGERLRRASAARDRPWLLTGDLPPHLLGDAGLAALHGFLPQNEDTFSTVAYTYDGDEFRMFEFKVRRCHIGRSHDWTECPFAHPGEKARRRDPRRFHYSGAPCPDFRRSGGCTRGNGCEFAHGVFETWLHPSRYRTQPCKDGPACPRRVCFFAHSPEQLRVVVRTSLKDGGVASTSPTSALALALAPLSPPSSGSSPPLSPVAVDEVAAAMRALHLNEVRPRLPFVRGPLAQGRREAADRAPVGVRAELFECCKGEEEEQSPDLRWISELVKD